MNKVKKDCMYCAYGGVHHMIEKWKMCRNENNKQRFTVKDIIAKFGVDENYCKKCKLFIPKIEIEKEYMSFGYFISLAHQCPYCGNEEKLIDVDSEGEKIIECNYCSKKYQIHWSLY